MRGPILFGFGVGERSRFFRIDRDLERLRECDERETDKPFCFFKSLSVLLRSLSLDRGLSFEPLKYLLN